MIKESPFRGYTSSDENAYVFINQEAPIETKKYFAEELSKLVYPTEKIIVFGPGLVTAEKEKEGNFACFLISDILSLDTQKKQAEEMQNFILENKINMEKDSGLLEVLPIEWADILSSTFMVPSLIFYSKILETPLITPEKNILNTGRILGISELFFNKFIEKSKEEARVECTKLSLDYTS